MELLTTQASALLFYAFAAVVLAGGLTVVIARNPMLGAFGLLSTLLGVAGLFLLRAAEFVAAVQVLVYGGGVMVLFIFVIMLIRLQDVREAGRFLPGAPARAVVGLGLGALLATSFAAVRLGGAASQLALRQVDGETVGNTAALAWRLYRDFLLPFEIASLYLVVAMIGAIVLARRGEP